MLLPNLQALASARAHRGSKSSEKIDSAIAVDRRSNAIIIVFKLSYLSKSYCQMLADKTNNKLIRRQISIILIFFLVFTSVYDLAYADKASLQNIVIDDTNGDLIVSFRLENVFSSQMQEVLLNGIPITFTYLVAVHEIRNFWIDKQIVNLKIDHMVKYNVLKKEFVIKRSWQIDEVLITKSFAEAQSLMTEISGFRIIPFNWLDTDNRYKVGIKAELSKANLPMNLRSSLFFSPSWGFETDWYIVNFNHRKALLLGFFAIPAWQDVTSERRTEDGEIDLSRERRWWMR